MSDPLVIAAFEVLLTAAPIPYVDTLNLRPATLPDQYVSLERDHSTVIRVTLGLPAMFRENGVLSILVSVRSGYGSTSAGGLAEQVRDLFHDCTVGHFRVLSVGSAFVISPDDGNYFQLKIPVEYEFDFFKP